LLPLDALSADEARGLTGLLFDLDDTLLDHGRLGEAAYSALFRLRESGLGLVAVTGRPAGWGEVIARQWPIEGAVTENGAVALYRDGAALRRIDPVDEMGRRLRRIRIAEIVSEIQERFPDLRAADDTVLRISDFTFDVGEQRRVAPDVVRAAAELARSRGAATITSSVHFHVSMDREDKASGTVRFLHERLGVDPTLARFRWAYAGDSENDAAAFAAFRTTFAVANFAGRPSVGPRFLSRAERGAGFAEIAARLVALRKPG
jgi:HAD superfamily hydrolase (TIGR01484 family)